MIPTNKPMTRDDESDLVFKTQKAKFQAVAEEIMELHEQQRPVLVGTVSIELSEYLSELLRRQGVEHQVLNAKFHEQEAGIITQAGRVGAVTIATNMAGRGTDILLGGNPDGLALRVAQSKGIDPEAQAEEFEAILTQTREQCAEEHEQVVALGGLHILGTERHESRRIDNQLRGRAGRQGDPGSSRFYVSLGDDVMRRFGGERVRQFMEWAGLEDDVPIENGLVSKSIENAQTKVEGYNFDIRKHLVDYDDVMNKQRETIYQERRKVLEGADLRANVLGIVHREIDSLLSLHLQGRDSDEWEVESLFAELGTMLPPLEGLTEESVRTMSTDEVAEALHLHADGIYEAKEQQVSEDVMRILERVVTLRTIDSLWVEHLTAMESMRQGIGLRAVGQMDPLVAYKREAFEMYGQVQDSMQRDIAHTIFRVGLAQEAPPPAVRNVRTNRDDSPALIEPGRAAAAVPGSPLAGRATAAATAAAPASRKVGRNEPCWCGSGKKFKRCHGS